MGRGRHSNYECNVKLSYSEVGQACSNLYCSTHWCTGEYEYSNAYIYASVHYIYRDYGHCKLLAAEECEHYVSLSVAVIPDNTDTPS